jgi:hypothetical protein
MEIPSKFEEQILQMPECSYGVTRVNVILDDDTTISDVYVAWGKEIVKVGENAIVSFDPTRITAIQRP